MSKTHYTFCDKLGHRLFIRWLDEDGKRGQKVFSDTPLELFIPGTRDDARGLHGERLSRVEFGSVEDMVDFAKEYDGVTPVFGQTSAAHQYISRQWPGHIDFDIKNFTILNFDIEVESREGFPHPEQAAYPLTSVSMKVFGKDERITLGLKPYTKGRSQDVYEHCRDERDLLMRFLHHWKRINPEIVTGWFIDSFDIPYIVNRMTKILGEEMTAQLSPFYHETKRVFMESKVGRGETTYRILGITSFDYANLYMKFAPKKLESYRLDYVCEHEKVGRKLDWHELGFSDLNDLYDRDHDTFIEYNERDVECVEQLDAKLKFIQCAITIVYMTHSRFSEALATVKPWDNFIYNMLLEDGIQIPPEAFTKNAEGIVGAYVKVPIPGKYRWVIALDMKSLYPCIDMMYNMSPETLEYHAASNPMEFMEKVLANDPVTMRLIEERKSKGLCTASNGSSYRQDSPGVIPRGMKFLFDTRSEVKGVHMKAAKKRLEAAKKAGEDYLLIEQEYQKLDAYQQALKVVANGGYGALSNQSFRYYNTDIAEGITITGQMSIKYGGAKLNAFLNERFKTTDVDYVIYTDTDSCYITVERFVTDVLKVPEADWKRKMQGIVDAIDSFVKKEIDPMLDKVFSDLCEKVGSVNNTMEMKRESISDVGIFRARKNYVLQVWDNEGVRYAEPDIKSVGVEINRTSTPYIVRDALKESLNILLNGTNDELLAYLAKFKKEFAEVPLSKIAFPRGVSEIKKWAGGVMDFEKGTPIHVRGAILFNKMVRERGLEGKLSLIQEGNKIKFIYLKEPNPLHSNVIGFIDELPSEFGLDKYVDIDLQYEKTFLAPLLSFTDIIDWVVEKKSSLDDMWS